MKTEFVTLLCLLLNVGLYGQQFQALSADDFNNFNQNAALINLHESEIYGLRYKNNQSAIEHNFEYINAFIEYALPYQDAGLGLSFEKETANAIQKYDIGLGYNYRLFLGSSARHQINLGLDLHYLNLGFDVDKFIVQHPDDPYLTALNNNGNGIYTGIGIAYKYQFSKYASQHAKFENSFLLIGISHKNVIATNPSLASVQYVLENHYSLQLQGRFKISSAFQTQPLFIEPHVLINSHQGRFNQMLFALNFTYNNRLQWGAYASLHREIGLNLGYKFPNLIKDFTPFIQTAFGLSNLSEVATIGPNVYVSLGMSKKITQ